MELKKDMFRQRERALENEFFHKVDQELIRRMRAKFQAEQNRDALAAETGITDPAVLDELVSLGITPQTLMALSLVPLVQVAWADRIVDAREREAALKAAKGAGLSDDSTGFQLLKSWLYQRPEEELFAAWKHYAAALAAILPAEQIESLRNDLVARAREVAKATGGFLGIGSISDVEETTLEGIETAFMAPAP